MRTFYSTYICELAEEDDLFCIAMTFKEAVVWFDDYVTKYLPNDKIEKVELRDNDVLITANVLRLLRENMESVE